MLQIQLAYNAKRRWFALESGLDAPNRASRLCKTRRLYELREEALKVKREKLREKKPRLNCRANVQEQITTLNPNWTVEAVGEMRPDGDVEIPDSALANFRVPFCNDCGEQSILKTDVVFFGGLLRHLAA